MTMTQCIFNRHFECEAYVSYIFLGVCLIFFPSPVFLIHEAGKHRCITVICTQGKFSAYGWQKRAHN